MLLADGFVQHVFATCIAQRAVTHGNHGLQVFNALISTQMISFINHQNIRNFKNTGFNALDIITHARNVHNQRRVGKIDDIHFTLAGANGFDDDVVIAGGVKSLA